MSKLILTLVCNDQKGIVAAVGNCISVQSGNITECGQYVDSANNKFFMRVCVELGQGVALSDFREVFSFVASAYGMQWQIYDAASKPRVMIIVSQLGHCLNDLLHRHSIEQLPMELVSIVSNHEHFRRRAEHEGLAFHYLPVTPANKQEQEDKLLEMVRDQQIDLVILARYMQILSDDLSRALAGHVINIHHSFLPSFKGARPYHQAHKRGVKLIGATAHYVTADLDERPIIEQNVQRIDHAATAEDLVAIGRDTECQVLARAVKLHLEHRILLNDDRTVIFH
ncbi:formyltetrahydrofolate deformylase [Pseudomonas tolaasii]|uniref:Formyltetrahydrofolate deformylase n=2 Tax=Pseudomonas tolaasii TaxID=29442 RepID=A0A7Y8DTY7_PSETO|nr:formyltetrahydrofolate deformylase [Pseudomonas tolaasii]ARB31320.1 formyltetrahydrofolate deformylase [Pseudomonas tolaasii]KAB0466576.1 formyltetrahydrofolate deformylase [Pseudomonas tolaasii]MBY8943435.1 formyltetrahydrofolate deformylase [Pseudomonas tolaasii]NVZ45471.1 formyltetrahydrofolate deformylase [Pseudomonas tolaasii]NWA48549.1 formyltetrahydrofolate deformylase [Pseudomonas tolaasii]